MASCFRGGIHVESAAFSFPLVRPVFTALRIGTLYFGSSFLTANWLTRMPDLLVHLGVDKATMGLALFLGPVGALVTAPIAGPLMDRFAAARVSVAGLALAAAMLLGIGLAGHWMVLAVMLFFAGAGNTLFEIGGNAGIQRLEVTTGGKYMSQCHGYWSLGFVGGALSAGLFGQFGVPLVWHLAAMAAVGVVACVGIALVLPAPMYERVTRPPDAAKPPFITLPSVGLIGLCVMATGVTLAEGAVYDWGTLFLREQLQPNPFWTSVAYGTFPLTMFLGRLAGDWFRARYRASSIVRVCAAVTVVGLVGFIFSPHILVSGLSLALMGVGVSLVMPIGVAAAGDKPGDAARNVAAMSMIITAIFLLAPPGVGFIAQHFGLTAAFLLMLPFVAASGVFAREADPPLRDCDGQQKMIGDRPAVDATNAVG